VLVRRDPLFRNMYSTKPLGARVSEDGTVTTFGVFSPRATAVRLHLYRDRDDSPSETLRVVELAKDTDGVWEATEPGDLHGMWYDFTVHGPADPGNRFFETDPVHISDPYALVNDDALGRSLVWRDGGPPPPVAGGRPRMEDVVAYEVLVAWLRAPGERRVDVLTELLRARDEATVRHIAARVAARGATAGRAS